MTVHLAVFPLPSKALQVMVVLPLVRAVTTPSSTVATWGLLLLQSASGETGSLLASSIVTVKVAVFPV